MRFLFGLAALMFAVPSHAQNDEVTYHVCVISGSGSKGPYSTVAITEPFPVGKLPGGMSDLNDAFQSFLRDVVRGRASIAGINPSTLTGGHCQSGSSDINNAYQIISRSRDNHKEVFVLFPSPIGRDGRYLRSGTTSAATASSKIRPENNGGTKAEPSRAQLVDTPAGQILMTPEKKAAYEARLAEHKRQLAERERLIAEAAAKHAANKAAAEANHAKHERELAEHRETVAQMERDAAAIRAEWAMRAAGQEPGKEDDKPVEFKEGVVLCQQPSPSSKSFNCQGPLQNVSTPLDEARAQTALGQACGSDRSIRDLGMVKGYRAFGCGFGIHPTARDYPGNADVPARLGIDFIPGRGKYFCPKSKLAYCR